MNALKRALQLLFILLIANPLFARYDQRAADSLQAILKSAPAAAKKQEVMCRLSMFYVATDSAKAKEYLSQATALAQQSGDSAGLVLAQFARAYNEYQSGDPERAQQLLEKAAPLLRRFKWDADYAECCSDVGHLHINKGDYMTSIGWYERSAEMARKLKDDELLDDDLIYTGMAYNQMGEHPKGLSYLQQGLEIAEKRNDRRVIAHVLLFIGSSYSESPNQDYAMRYFQRCRDISVELKDTLAIIEVDTYIANNHYYNKRYREAIAIYEQVAAIAKNRSERVYAGALGNLGNVYADMGNYDKALEYQFEAIEVFKKEGDVQGLTICYSAIGSSYYTLKKYDLALDYYYKALDLAKEMNSMEDLIEDYEGLSKTYEARNDYRKAYENFKLFKQYSDSIYNESNTKKLTELEMNYRFRSQQKEQELEQRNKETLANEKLVRQQQLSYISIVGIILLLLLVGIILRSNNQRRRANEKLRDVNHEIVQQKEVIEYKNKEITDSINYAKRIQESILPVRAEIRQAFRDSFVLFKPRDVVSGDFYWFAQHGDVCVIACVDCTGHGVPGAFMSMIGNTLLNEIVNEKGIRKPSEILNLLHDRVRQSLKQDQERTETQDGMDIALCMIDERAGMLEFAGANRPLYLVRDNALHEIRPTKSPIGGEQAGARIFANNEVPIAKGDCIYMSTDGYADQFGGPKGKKFMVKRFQELLLQICAMPMEEQGQRLKQSIEDWQGNTDQVDDILVIGIKIA